MVSPFAVSEMTMESTPSRRRCPLLNGHGFEGAVAVPGCVDPHRTDLGDHRLGPGAVAGVLPIAVLHGVLGVAQVLLQLDLEGGLQQLLPEIAHQAPGANALHAVGPGLLNQLLGDAAAHRPRLRRRRQPGSLTRRRGCGQS